MLKIMCLAVTLALAMPSLASAQNVASNKSFFYKNTNGITLAAVSNQGFSKPVPVFDASEALKTSNGGAVSAILSMEAALWTYNLTTAIVNDPLCSKRNTNSCSSSSSRATIKAWVEVDGTPMAPGEVVYADRLQATGLTVNLFCTVTDTAGIPLPCTVTGDVTLELFQQTKNANSFAFFLGPLAPKIHSVVVWAQAQIECRSNGEAIACPAATLDGYAAQTAAAIGRATLLVEEQQNWGSQ